MRAVLAPRLGEGLQLAIGRVAAEFAKVSLHGAKLGQAHRKLARPAQIQERRVVHPGDGHVDATEMVSLPLSEPFERQASDDRLFDGIVRKHALNQSRECRFRSVDPIRTHRPDVLSGEAEIAKESQRALTFRISHARFG